MLGGVPVVDAMVQSIDDVDSTAGPAISKAEMGRAGESWASQSDEDYVLDEERYERRHSAEELLWSCFAESATDIATHHVRRSAADQDGWSSWEIALRFRELAGRERVLLAARPSDPWDYQRSVAELDEMIDLDGVAGLGLAISPGEGGPRTRRDLVGYHEHSLRLVGHARERGLRAISVYLSGPVLDPGTIGCLARLACSFPDMDFDVVRSGAAAWADLTPVTELPNLYLNLAGTSSLLLTAPRRFAEVLGALLREGMGRGIADRILWGTGATAVHPRLLVDLFWGFDMPEDLVKNHAYPELTDLMKKDILSGNFARKNRLDLEAAIAAIPDDPMRQAQLAGDFAKPWSHVPARAAALDGSGGDRERFA